MNLRHQSLLQSLLSSELPEDKRFGDVLTSLQDIQKSVLKCERKLSHPEEILPPEYITHITSRFFRDRIHPEFIHSIILNMEELESALDKYAKKPSAPLLKNVIVIKGRLIEMLHYIVRKTER